MKNRFFPVFRFFIFRECAFYCLVGLVFSNVSLYFLLLGLPGRLHEVVLRIALLDLDHLREDGLVLLGRECVLLLEEGDGDSGVGVCAYALRNVLVARLDELARV